MNQLEQIASTFGTSKPVFIAKLKYDDEHIELELKDPYDPSHGFEGNDPVRKLLVHRWSESLNKETKCFEGSVGFNEAYNDMRNAVVEFFIENSPLKNPRQTKLYKWLSSNDLHQMGYKHPTADGFIALFRYLHAEGYAAIQGHSSSPVTKNVIAILELMRGKYEGK